MPDRSPPKFLIVEYLSNLWSRKAIRRLLIALLVLNIVIAYGVIGYVALGWHIFDAFYMVVITISGVGYGEVRETGSAIERVHTILLISMGVVAVAFSLASLVALLTEGEFQRALGFQRMRRQIEDLSNHTIIAGFGRIGALVAEELVANGHSFVVIERAVDRIAEIERRMFPYVQGDATDEAILVAAGLDRAKVLVSVMPSDADNVFVTLTAKQYAPKVQIISRAEQPTTHKTLRQAGANHIVMPAAIGAHRIASLLTNPSAVEFAELVTNQSRLSLEMAEIPITSTSRLVGKTIAEADIRRRTNAIVVAIKYQNGAMDYPANNDHPLATGDVVVLLGRHSNLEAFREIYFDDLA
jgi:voltage-gated potassium channel